MQTINHYSSIVGKLSPRSISKGVAHFKHFGASFKSISLFLFFLGEGGSRCDLFCLLNVCFVFLFPKLGFICFPSLLTSLPPFNFFFLSFFLFSFFLSFFLSFFVFYFFFFSFILKFSNFFIFFSLSDSFSSLFLILINFIVFLFVLNMAFFI